jgi:hypothetical protein
MLGMGLLRELHGARSCILEPEHVVGRTSHCSLLLSHAHISGQHALLRWTGQHWEVLDRGSRNGTFLNGVALPSGHGSRLDEGSVLYFGHPDEQWRLEDASAPSVMVLGDTAEIWSASEDGVIGIPSNAQPECQVYRDVDALWKLERPGKVTVAVRHGERFEASGRWWRFSCPDPVGATATSEQPLPSRAGVLEFAVSRDEEFVKITVASEARQVDVGSRSHNYLLLTLARTRLRDRDSGFPDSSCGWMDKDELAQQLGMSPEQIDGEVFRIRQHFTRHGLDGAASIIERRPRIKQLRIGWGELKLTST